MWQEKANSAERFYRQRPINGRPMFRKCPPCTDSGLYHELAFPSPKSAHAPLLREQRVFQVAEGGRIPVRDEPFCVNFHNIPIFLGELQ